MGQDSMRRFKYAIKLFDMEIDNNRHFSICCRADKFR